MSTKSARCKRKRKNRRNFHGLKLAGTNLSLQLKRK
jgi:hypothetical protein